MEFLTIQYKKHDAFLQYRKAVSQICSVKKFFKTSPAAASEYQNLTQMKM